VHCAALPWLHLEQRRFVARSGEQLWSFSREAK
jgi:hypothetical protein